MRNRQQQAHEKSVMLGDAIQAPWVMENMHDKPTCTLPDNIQGYLHRIDTDLAAAEPAAGRVLPVLCIIFFSAVC